MQKNKDIATWMDENGLTADSLAQAVDYSTGATRKWRQKVSAPTKRAEKAIIKVGKRLGWTEFPARLAV